VLPSSFPDFPMPCLSAGSISVTSRHTVNCDHDISWKSFDWPYRLGPIDPIRPTNVQPIIPIAVVLVYQTDSSSDIPIKQLQHALMLLMKYYYSHLTVRLHIASDGIPEIHRLGSGAELLEDQCSERLDTITSSSGRILLSDLPEEGNALSPTIDPRP